MNVGRWQFILWKRWAFIVPSRCVDAPLGYIYDFMAMIGPLEIRRFKRRL